MANRPNYFLAFRISNLPIISTAARIQQEIAHQSPQLKKSLTKLRKLHITLGVFHTTDSNIPHLRNTLDEWAAWRIPEIFSTPINLTFLNCRTFPQGVLFADAVKNDEYERATRLALELRELFVNEPGISNYSKDFKLHLTLLKRPACRKQFKQIAEGLVNSSIPFGEQKIESIQLLSMIQQDSEGYYYCLHEVSTTPSVPRGPFPFFQRGKRHFSTAICPSTSSALPEKMNKADEGAATSDKWLHRLLGTAAAVAIIGLFILQKQAK